MPRFVYTPEHIEFLRRYPRLPIRELTARFNAEFGVSLRYGQIRSCLSNHGIKGDRRRGNARPDLRVYSDEHLVWLAEHYPRMPIQDLTTAFNERFGMDKSAVNLHALLTRKGIRSGRDDGRFKKGFTPWNKGTSWTAGGRSAETRFKPGQKPPNVAPIGTEVLDRDGFRKVKVRDDAPKGLSRHNWKYVHVLVWEEANGPVPPGHNVSFRDGNRQNCELDNLVLLSREVNLQLNRYGYGEITDPDLRRAMRHLARLKVKQYRVEKNHGLRKPGPGSRESKA